MRDRFLPSSALAEWESILTGRSPEGAAQPRIAADDWARSSSKIFAAPPGLRAALAAADHARITETAYRWVDQYGANYGSLEPGEVDLILYEWPSWSDRRTPRGKASTCGCADGDAH
jgi:hypothetical protein